MLSKIVLSVVVVGLCGPSCLAQSPKPSSVIATPRIAPLDISPWLFPARHGSEDLTLFPEWTTPATLSNPLKINWRPTELTARLSSIHIGMPFNIAVQRLRVLGGTEDGGLQSIPATRYFFSPGTIVNIPEQNGYVAGPLSFTRGYMAVD